MSNANLKRLCVGLAFSTALVGCGRITENEVAPIMKAGAITEVVTKPTLYCMPFCWPTTDIIRYKTFADTFTFSSGKGAATGENQQAQTAQARQIFLRSKDDKFIESVSFSIPYEIVPTENAKLLITEFRADKETWEENAPLIRDDIQILSAQPLVDIIRKYDALEIQDKGVEIGKELTKAIQKAVDERLGLKEGDVSPIKIKPVIFGGVKFDDETEKLLKQKIFAREQGAIADELGRAAEKQTAAAKSQAGVTAEIVDVIMKKGVPGGSNALPSLVCLDMKRQGLVDKNTACFSVGAPAVQ